MNKRITGDDDLRKQYQKELSEIHAPKELAERVKLAAGQERGKRGTADRSFWGYAAAIAAAVVVLLVCAVVFGGRILDGSNHEKMPVQLGTEDMGETDYIPRTETQTVSGGLTVSMTDKTKDDVLGRDAEDMTIKELRVVVSVNVISGYYQCFYEEEGQNYLITSKTADRETFLEELYGFLGAE